MNFLSRRLRVPSTASAAVCKLWGAVSLFLSGTWREVWVRPISFVILALRPLKVFNNSCAAITRKLIFGGAADQRKRDLLFWWTCASLQINTFLSVNFITIVCYQDGLDINIIYIWTWSIRKCNRRLIASMTSLRNFICTNSTSVINYGIVLNVYCELEITVYCAKC